MGSNPSYFIGDDNPVERVSYDDCLTFIDKLNGLLARKLPDGRKFRLPTEAEWEFAARGGNSSRGYRYSGGNVVDDVAWCNEWCLDARRTPDPAKTHPVKQKYSNELGIYDMSGNVCEICSDWKASYSSLPQTDPKGPSSGSGRVLRGGTYDLDARFSRVAFRDYLESNGNSRTGLRLVL